MLGDILGRVGNGDGAKPQCRSAGLARVCECLGLFGGSTGERYGNTARAGGDARDHNVGGTHTLYALLSLLRRDVWATWWRQTVPTRRTNQQRYKGTCGTTELAETNSGIWSHGEQIVIENAKAIGLTGLGCFSRLPMREEVYLPVSAARGVRRARAASPVRSRRFAWPAIHPRRRARDRPPNRHAS